MIDLDHLTLAIAILGLLTLVAIHVHFAAMRRRRKMGVSL